ncbi:hypothetical protein LJK87_00690 [Paenibacillus sp. P25]|nr:hypothetical protein LJK87_00690 [Paenibacillus sp. P25]
MTTDHSASGQALGYVYQFDRATYRLFQSGVDVVEVGVEDIDDVSVHYGSGKEIREQDKSTVNSGSPLSDRSVALWKTLHIWAELILCTPSIIDTTEFHIATNGLISTKCLARRINEATDKESAKVVCSELRQIIPTLRDDLVSFGTTIGKLSDKQLKALIIKISVFDKMSSQYGGNLEDLQALRFFESGMKVGLFDRMNGWVKGKSEYKLKPDNNPESLEKTLIKSFRDYTERQQLLNCQL